MRPISALNFMLTAKPAASSSGVMILDPEDNFESDLLRLLEEASRVRCANSEVVLVLITMRQSFVFSVVSRVRATRGVFYSLLKLP